MDLNVLALKRAKAGLTGMELAELANVDYSTVVNLEKNKVRARLTTLVKLANALDCPVEELTPLLSEPPANPRPTRSKLAQGQELKPRGGDRKSKKQSLDTQQVGSAA